MLIIWGYAYLNDVASNKTSTVLPANSRLTQFSSNVHVGEILFVEAGPRDELLLACSVNEAVRAPPRQHQRRLKEIVLWSPSYLCGRYVMEHINQPYKTHLFCGNTRKIFLRSWYNTGSASPGKKVNFYFIGIITIIAPSIYIFFFFPLATRKHTYSYNAHIQLTCLCGYYIISVALLFFPSFFPSPLLFIFFMFLLL